MVETFLDRLAALGIRGDRPGMDRMGHAAADEIERLRAAIAWALGYTDFQPRGEADPSYWWRKQLREMSGLTGGQLVAAAQPNQLEQGQG